MYFEYLNDTNWEKEREQKQKSTINYVISYEIFSRIHCFRINGAITYIFIMIKQVLIAIVLTSLLVGNSWDAEARERSVRQEKVVKFERSETKVREKRFINPFPSLFSIWNALTHIYSLYAEVSHLISHCLVIISF